MWTPSVVTALLFASTVQSASLFRSSHDSNHRVNRAVKQEVSDKCKFSVKTNTWSTCGKLIDHYNVTLPDFYYMNPDVEADCSQFHPGETYCLRFSTIIRRYL
ncbi:Peptidoglycan-binding Lysin subgroup [Penicillium cf. griseofulvum]|uniref:Peptidoglycan-binding Lysin subgroup n=1 Tax=Penicillium cf. griseofulvum TaxID=2972120 RepID=A0A9W9JND8_9EURO|nr:Peptidoglycan-binding Lysin subgroup [Penicillium cf. griseofulvum]KAJ5416371.1 Peptidoglycan-binding Lysin subgroup [Penicillium cf. griseofulvum]KAJ5442292.1 Peptidoglycan-binding Lysin subgroup [Penicillium cf. griseofulvum]